MTLPVYLSARIQKLYMHGSSTVGIKVSGGPCLWGKPRCWRRRRPWPWGSMGGTAHGAHSLRDPIHLRIFCRSCQRRHSPATTQPAQKPLHRGTRILRWRVATLFRLIKRTYWAARRDRMLQTGSKRPRGARQRGAQAGGDALLPQQRIEAQWPHQPISSLQQQLRRQGRHCRHRRRWCRRQLASPRCRPLPAVSRSPPAWCQGCHTTRRLQGLQVPGAAALAAAAAVTGMALRRRHRRQAPPAAAACME